MLPAMKFSSLFICLFTINRTESEGKLRFLRIRLISYNSNLHALNASSNWLKSHSPSSLYGNTNYYNSTKYFSVSLFTNNFSKIQVMPIRKTCLFIKWKIIRTHLCVHKHSKLTSRYRAREMSIHFEVSYYFNKVKKKGIICYNQVRNG